MTTRADANASRTPTHAELVIRAAEERYLKSRDPLDVWELISASLSANLPLPDCARDYLLDVGGKLWRRTWRERPAAGDVDRAAAEALGLHGRRGRNPFDRADKDLHDWAIAFDVWREMAHKDMVSAFKDVAEGHLARCDGKRCTKKPSWQKIRAAWYRHKHDVIPPSLANDR
jgi:hypothetical protein